MDNIVFKDRLRALSVRAKLRNESRFKRVVLRNRCKSTEIYKTGRKPYGRILTFFYDIQTTLLERRKTVIRGRRFIQLVCKSRTCALSASMKILIALSEAIYNKKSFARPFAVAYEGIYA